MGILQSNLLFEKGRQIFNNTNKKMELLRAGPVVCFNDSLTPVDDLIKNWNAGSCDIKVNGIINYEFVSLGSQFYNIGSVESLQAFDAIVSNARKQENASLLNRQTMNSSCNLVTSYEQINKDITKKLKNLCGCYVSPSANFFSVNEITLLQSEPECIPSCFNADIAIYNSDGTPENCSRSICIVDNVNTNAADVKITQICSFCTSFDSECICYVHVNNIYDTTGCATVTKISSDGTTVTQTDITKRQSTSSVYNSQDYLYIGLGIFGAVTIMGIAIGFLIMQTKKKERIAVAHVGSTQTTVQTLTKQ
jgi:hypothetical protein